MNKEQLHGYIADSKGNESNICQIHVIRSGETVYDDCWHGFKTEDAMNVNSVTKGVMSLLAGIAMDKGYIKGTDQKVMDFFPGYAVKRGERFGNMTYGYLWYMPHDDKPVYCAIGDCGNIIYTDKDRDIAVGMTGYFKPRIFDRVEFIENVLLPAVAG